MRGSVTFDQRTNTLLINDTAEKTVELRAIISQLDRPVQQVLDRIANCHCDR
jgi:type IV pilus assembly protein PilQ